MRVRFITTPPLCSWDCRRRVCQIADSAHSSQTGLAWSTLRLQNGVSSPFPVGLPFIDSAEVAAVYVRVISSAWNQNHGVIIAFCRDRIACYLSTFIDGPSFDNLQRSAGDDQSIQIEYRSSIPPERALSLIHWGPVFLPPRRAG